MEVIVLQREKKQKQMKWGEIEKGSNIDDLFLQTTEIKQDSSNEAVRKKRQCSYEQNSQMNFQF